ncbi:MAG TPA: D-2-hydroxyacid dehydrogenase [Bacteroidales bacterium]|nr:D-2-hydroxyacid dehydrogenase [Bacteroidales bacterium]HOK75518.1 D-2-hydroxyacid dehydrogenase [Bacteroidales bacterium]HOM41534.1 D-2-hydroxyacid dehydrogenase [Bacteroidales bacterium]HPP92410.1 D-2-hydroxyacid dehydrogenase [Bacteroidales bacterium]
MKIVVLDGYALNPGDISWDELKSLGEVEVYDRTPDNMITERAADAEIILTNKNLMMANVIEKLPRLKYIGVLATGYNVVDTEAAKRRGIIVTNVPAYSTASVAQHTFALILEFYNYPGKFSDEVREGRWSRNLDFCYWDKQLIELAGKTIGIVGFGRIGKAVARVAEALEMNVIVSEVTDVEGYENYPLDELLKRSDIVTLHCPLTPGTKGIINRERLRLMKPSALLVNCARGQLIVEHDLAEALNEGRIAGAALDVLSEEPPCPDNPLLKAKNCIITPHVAWATLEARQRLMKIAVNNVRSFMEGKPVNVVN